MRSAATTDPSKRLLLPLLFGLSRLDLQRPLIGPQLVLPNMRREARADRDVGQSRSSCRSILGCELRHRRRGGSWHRTHGRVRGAGLRTPVCQPIVVGGALVVLRTESAVGAAVHSDEVVAEMAAELRIVRGADRRSMLLLAGILVWVQMVIHYRPRLFSCAHSPPRLRAAERVRNPSVVPLTLFTSCQLRPSRPPPPPLSPKVAIRREA